MAKLAFKKWYKNGWASPLAGLTALWTGGKYSHVELMIGPNRGFSASAWDNEVRIKEIDFNTGKWDFIETDRAVNMPYIESVLGTKYDYLGIAFFEFLPFKLQRKNRSYCSETVSHALGIMPYQNDPVKLYKILVKENEYVHA